MDTIKLYDQDAYQTSFSAVVQSCEELSRKNGTVYQVLLDQTLFFPEEGGQSADTGILGDVNVLDVQIKGGIITHTLDKPLSVGASVTGKVDWQHRFFNMQQHTGEHIFSGLVHKYFGFDNVGFHLSDQVVTMDFSGPLSDEQVEKIEWAVNECIAANLPVEVSFPDKAELADMEYRSKIEIDGQVRIVSIPGYDVCACCAPHVHRTGEIGLLKVMNVSKYKAGVRVSILCGFRALKDYRMKQKNVVSISNSLSAKQDTIADAVGKLKEECGRLKMELGAAKMKLMTVKIQEIPLDQENVCLFEEDVDADIMRFTVNELVKNHCGYCAVFVGNDSDGYHYIIGSTDKDAREMGKLLREQFQAKGGGKPEMIQGSLTGTAASIAQLF
ncbi:MAG: alanine--tRNA ligase-related protein [Lachnospiraceae bacterium]|nr:alanine--tRNA ligase-related protein [Lachnospiraceae bacterium]MDD3617132.1 alanine--tRNA ligase-related protein [Lachnospiraceae bacterium]